MKLLAYAKVNWFLEILGRRLDGYHRLSTVFQTISLADELRLSPNNHEVSCRSSDPALPTDERNLAVRAAMRLREVLGERRGVHIELVKRIPLGAGLGGGSSDAAAILRGLPRFWERRASSAVLRRLAQPLGADIPFFLKGGCCLAGGVGERLTPLPTHPVWWLVLVKPAFGLSTPMVYHWFDDRCPRGGRSLTVRRAATTIRAALSRGIPPAQWGGQLFNRLEEAVIPRYREIAHIKAVLRSLGVVGTLMTGSGSAVFGVVRSRAQGEAVLGQFPRDLGQAWLVHTVNRLRS